MSSRTLNAVPPAFVSRPREELKEIAQDTLAAVRRGSYTVDDDSGGETHIIQDLSATPDPPLRILGLMRWETGRPLHHQSETHPQTLFSPKPPHWKGFVSLSCQYACFLQHRHGPPSSPVGAQFCVRHHSWRKLSRRRARTGRKASRARPTSIHPSPVPLPAPFYTAHSTRDNPRFSHAMLLTRNVRFVRDDAGAWIAPADVDVPDERRRKRKRTAQVPRIRDKEAPLPTAIAAEVSTIMRERMARILCAMARAGAEDVVLGSFGTGAFRNNVEFVAQTWAELLYGEQAPFRDVFRRVVFAIIDRGTWGVFCEVFRRAGASFPGNRAGRVDLKRRSESRTICTRRLCLARTGLELNHHMIDEFTG
ncbi:hypothetical protein B0H14DRAFT_3166025 [Mycena olivaceomarginata]|nr:hypothetical protein B0H14DRAFT_3166025 [Mycena olivaceomarginata]